MLVRFRYAAQKLWPCRIKVSSSDFHSEDHGAVPCLATDFQTFSSVGSEHLPYKQGVVGSSPTRSTKYLFISSGASATYEYDRVWGMYEIAELSYSYWKSQ